MAIRDMQAQLTELGRIRTGRRVMNRAGTKLIPQKLDSLRFTSPAEHLIDAISGLYGGEAKPFTGEGVVGKQFEVITDVDTIPVFLPRQKIDPFYEQWKGGVCVRRCDGDQDLIHGKPCDCASGEDRACKPTTRVNLLLADVPGIGVWRLETHGIYAAMELSQLAELLLNPRAPIPARLILELRQRKFFNQKKREVETRDYYVPIVLVDAVTSRQLQMGGDALSQALRMSVGADGPAQIEAAPTARAIEAPPAPAAIDPQIIERGLAMITSAPPEAMPDIHTRIVKLGSPQVLLDAFQNRLGEQAAQAKLAKAAETLPLPEPTDPADEVLEHLRTADRSEMEGLRQRVKEMGAPDLLVAAWKHRLSEHVTELRERIARAAPEGMSVLWGEIEKVGSPELLTGEWAAREAQLAAEAVATEVRDAELEESWSDQESPGEPEVPQVPTAPVPLSADELEARKDAMLALVGAAGKLKMKTADINGLINERYGVVATGATAEQLTALVTELKGRKP